MTHRNSHKRSVHHLKKLLELTVTDLFQPSRRGLAFIVDELEVSGSPPQRLRAWATLHFLRLGSPFCCMEPSCHVPLFAHHLESVSDELRRRMGLTQPVSVRFPDVAVVPHAEVEFDDINGFPPNFNRNEVDRRDALGRTALMRAARHGHDHVVEYLLGLGADPSVVDYRGRGVLEQAASRVWISKLIGDALASSSRPG
jgi:hypothetical protein